MIARGFVHELDVRDLEPPLPFERCLEAILGLAPGELLRFIHRREPFPLYGALERQGFTHVTRELAPGHFHVLIWRREDELAASRAAALSEQP